jgi:ketosteroid isomerase-like protein
MSSGPLDLHVDLDKAKIAAVRHAWVDAVKRSDADRLADLVTYDVVGVHANGRCTVGKENLKHFFLDVFDQFNLEGIIESSEIVVHGIWAVEIDEVQTKRTRVEGNLPIDSRFRAVFVFCRQLDDSWKVSRVIELQD